MRLRCYDLEGQIVEEYYVDDPTLTIRLEHKPKPQTVQVWYNGLRMTELSFDPEADLQDLVPLVAGDCLTFIYNALPETPGERMVRRLRGTGYPGLTSDEIMVELRGEPDH